MPTGATGQLGLALPVQGELTGTWGNTVNNAITEYTNIAIAATLTLTNDGAVTLANTTGTDLATNITSSLTGAGTVTAQFAIVRVTGTLTTAKVVTAPSYSKTYTVVNAATGGIVTFKASGQTGVSIAVGESAFVYFNGTDYVKVSGTSAVSSFTAGTTGFTPSTATTGAVTLAGTLATTNGGTGLTSFTSGGVVYASSSSALATGSGLQFDGSNLGINITPSAWSAQFKAIQFGNARYGTISQRNNSTSEFNLGWNVYNTSTGTSGSDGWVGLNTGDASSLYMLGGATHTWLVSSTAATAGSPVTWTSSMVFNSNGRLGVGTSSPSAKLQVGATSDTSFAMSNSSSVTSGNRGTVYMYNSSDSTVGAIRFGAVTDNVGTNIQFYTRPVAGSLTQSMTLTEDGNLGIGSVGAGNKFTVSNGGANGFEVDPLSTSGTKTKILSINRATSAYTPFSYDASLHEFQTSGGEKARISAAGGFSVGTTADPGAGAIYATGNITAYYSSDIKFKENVRDIPDALATVNAIGGKLFDWKDDYIESKGGADGYFVQKADFGVVAQDVQKVFPIAVRTRDDGSLAVDYEKLGALAFAALVELTKRVEALESK